VRLGTRPPSPSPPRGGLIGLGPQAKSPSQTPGPPQRPRSRTPGRSARRVGTRVRQAQPRGPPPSVPPASGVSAPPAAPVPAPGSPRPRPPNSPSPPQLDRQPAPG